jgi:hypothetical protein
MLSPPPLLSLGAVRDALVLWVLRLVLPPAALLLL